MGESCERRGRTEARHILALASVSAQEVRTKMHGFPLWFTHC